VLTHDRPWSQTRLSDPILIEANEIDFTGLIVGTSGAAEPRSSGQSAGTLDLVEIDHQPGTDGNRPKLGTEHFLHGVGGVFAGDIRADGGDLQLPRRDRPAFRQTQRHRREARSDQVYDPEKRGRLQLDEHAAHL
jgi:hypothetical protein